MEEPVVVVVVEFPERGWGRVALDFAGGAGAATVVVVAIVGEMDSPNAGAFMKWMVAGSKKVVPHDRDSK
jgi:hypothetical protein